MPNRPIHIPVQRNTLLLFLGVLLAIIAFSGAAGLASVFWKVPETAGDAAKTKKNSPKVAQIHVDGDDDEDTPAPKPQKMGVYKNGTLTGRVTDADSGKPIAGAAVRVGWTPEITEESRHGGAVIIRSANTSSRKSDKQSALTDADGKYTIEVPESYNNVDITFSKRRYRTIPKYVRFEGAMELNTELEPVPCVILNVQDKNGNRVNDFVAEYSKSGLLWGSSHRSESFHISPIDEAATMLDRGTWTVTVRAGKLSTKQPTRFSMSDADQTVNLTVE
ncbi:MAG: carboxypeptidase regulatory-like domain-containing protein [Planctomycetes bacterium]|nr:carboxypeptidase regulatory-like domain-containing protein [Planctomycetota bacterium]